MPELSVTDEQLRRLETVCEDLEAAYVGPYGSVQPDDALEYLLDSYSPPAEDEGREKEEEGKRGSAPESADTDAGAGPSSSGRDAADLTTIEGVGEVTAEALVEAGFDSLAAVEAADPAALTEAEGIGEKQAVDIVAAATERDDPGNDPEPDADAGDGGRPGSGDPADNSPADTLQQAMSLLDAHDDRWREGSGDEPYEVDLPDGSTEAVRTKDDVKRLLFKHWK